MVTERFAVVENVLAFSRVPVHVNKTKLVKVLLLFTRFCQAFRQGTCGIVKLGGGGGVQPQKTKPKMGFQTIFGFFGFF